MPPLHVAIPPMERSDRAGRKPLIGIVTVHS